MKNLLILHLESISRQRLAAFPGAFPHLSRLMREALVFDRFYSSATSSLMTIAYFFHGNDFEFDVESKFQGMRPARNNPNFFSTLRARGYHSQVICLNALQAVRPRLLTGLSDDLPEIWGTHDFPTLFAKFDALTDSRPFAIYVWDLLTHVEHSLALASYSSGLTDQVRRACAVADDAIGALLAILERKEMLESTTIVAYGDHGDDFWTHGFNAGLLHATEPRTDVTWVPLAIRDASLAPRVTEQLASTIDIAPTCLALAGIDAPMPFPFSGRCLLDGESDVVYSQNLTANQPDDPTLEMGQAFAVTDRDHTLVASRRGLALHAHRLDPGNHCNLLHFFTLRDHRLAFDERARVAEHFRVALQANQRAVESLEATFHGLRDKLAARVAAKRAYITQRGVSPTNALDPAVFDVIDRRGREAFFGSHARAAPAPLASAAFDFSLRIR